MKSIFRFIALAIGLGIIGGVFGVIGALIGGRGIGENSFGALGLAFIGLLGGYLLGIIVGIILIKKWLRQRGSVTLGITGGIIGAVITVLTGVTWDPNAAILFSVLFFTTPVFCLAGFYLKR